MLHFWQAVFYNTKNQMVDFIKPFIFHALFREGSCQNEWVWFSLTMIGWLDSSWQNNSVKYTISGRKNLNWLVDKNNGSCRYIIYLSIYLIYTERHRDREMKWKLKECHVHKDVFVIEQGNIQSSHYVSCDSQSSIIS